MRWRLVKLHWHFWRESYRRRLLEVVFWRKHKHAWRAGYGASGAGILEYGFECAVRLAELLGLGLVLTIADGLFAGKRYRSLSASESAFAKTYFTEDELATVLIDQGAKWTAGKLRIAFVAGFLIKTHGRFDRRLLIHELVHVRQFRRWGWAYAAKALMAQWTGDGYSVPSQFAFSGKSYRDGLARPTFHPALNAEQEARRLEEWVVGPSPWS